MTQPLLEKSSENTASSNSEYWIVIPTYNEKDNIERLIVEIHRICPDVSIMIVDDNSPDGTGEIVEALSKAHDSIHILRRPGKLGIGSALIAGFNDAIANGAKYVIEMDADFSHQPAYLPKLIEKSREYDLVIGSRFVRGGKIANRGWFRNVVSKAGNFFIRTTLDLKPKDCTSGYRCFSVPLLESIDIETITSSCYGNLTETLYRCKKKGFDIGEIPIIFPDRKFGKSKLTKQQFIDVTRTVLKLRFNKS